MRKWLAEKLFAWAVWLSWDEAAQVPKKKRGRPLGRKDSVGSVPAKKRGRPLGSKNRPKVQL